MKLCVIPADGIGREVVPAAVEIVQAVVPELEVVHAEAGWGCFQEQGVSVPEQTIAAVQNCDGALFGAVSSPSGKVEGYQSAIVTLRRKLNLYANLRPVRSLPVPGLRQDVDLVIFRENTEGLYSGRERLSADGSTAITERVITRQASARIARRAFEYARNSGRRRVTIVHKANVMPLSDGLFRQVCQEVGQDYPDLEVDEMLADIAAFWLVRDPARFDVIVTTNMFGDILSDAAAHWGGGMGMVPSLNIGDGAILAEPVHGSAPDIAGLGIANPLAAVLSAALLLKHVAGLQQAGERIETAVFRLIQRGTTLPRDLGGQATTAEVLQGVLAQLQD